MNLLFVTDIHGSEKCFRKFLNSWKYYPIDCLIMGGDLSGKGLVPIIREKTNTYKATFIEDKIEISGTEELHALEKNIRFNGFYPFITDEEGVNRLENDKNWRKQIFKESIIEQVERWDKLATEYLKESKIKIFIIPGNDDIYEIDDVLNTSKRMINSDGGIQELVKGWYLIGAGYSNHTPWNGPREYDEELIYEKVMTLVKNIPQKNNAIYDFHCPPYDSGIDLVQDVDKDFRPKYQGINPVLIPGGSKAIRDIYDNYPPKLGLHGHIHESKGVWKHKGAIALNPGSEYSSGIMKGVIVSINETKVKSHMFIEG